MTAPVTVDWVLRHAHLPSQPAAVDIAIQGPRIAALGPSLALRGRQELDLAGRLVLPGFVDAHLHLDRALALDDGMLPADSLDAAIAAFFQWRHSVTPERIYTNALRVAERALQHGTIALRTHVTIDAQGGLELLDPILRLREAMAPKLIIQIVAFPDSPDVDAGRATPLLRQAIAAGADLIGGAPAKSAAPQRFVDTILDLAGSLDCALDLHIDETDDPSSNTLEYLAERTLATGFRRTVTAGHCCALAAQDEVTARRVIEKVAEAGLHILTLPYCNLYLMGRQDRGLVRRGLTRVRDLAAAGVNVAYGSDNIRDPFNPFGNADLLQAALITGLALQMGTPAELADVVAMATSNPARILELDDYGLAQGNIASLVVVDAGDLGTAVATTAPRRYVFARGQLVAQTVVESRLL